MALKNSILRVQLFFDGDKKPELIKTIVLPPGYEKKEALICKRGKRTENTFQWGTGPIALSLFFVRYAAWCSNKKSPRLFEFVGKIGSPAHTLETSVLKKCDGLNWTLDMFGNAEGTDHNHLLSVIEKGSSDKSQAETPYRQGVNVKLLPFDALTINWRNADLNKTAEFEVLAVKLEEQWKNCITTPEISNKIEAAKQQQAEVKEDRPAEAKRAESDQRQTMAQQFRSLSVVSIISYITTAMLPARGSLAIENFSAEILSPECVNVLAEKLVSDSIRNFNDFFHATFEPPWESLPLVPDELNPQKIKELRFEGARVPDIKRSIGIFIASNRDLRERLAFMVARCNFPDMWYWFTAISFCKDRQSERKIAHEVELALNAAAEEPGFKENFLIYAPEKLPRLIQYFLDYDCVVAARLFEKINEEGRQEEARIRGIIYGDTSAKKS